MATNATKRTGKAAAGTRLVPPPARRAKKRKPYALALEDDLLAIGKAVPIEEWEKLPRDFNENLDHYLYGSPKKKPTRR